MFIDENERRRRKRNVSYNFGLWTKPRQVFGIINELHSVAWGCERILDTIGTLVDGVF